MNKLTTSEYKFFPCKDSKQAIVFLPSANTKSIYPYFPRISRQSELAKVANIVYLTDPFQHLEPYKTPMASWYISPQGQSLIPEVVTELKAFLTHHGIEEVLFYGSSMGGYAAIIFSSLFPGSKAIAECPQIYMAKHPGSKYVSEHILSKDIAVNTIEPLHYLLTSEAAEVKIITSLYDSHYLAHIVPLCEQINALKEPLKPKIEFINYSEKVNKRGHIALSKENAIPLIVKTLSTNREI